MEQSGWLYSHSVTESFRIIPPLPFSSSYGFLFLKIVLFYLSFLLSFSIIESLYILYNHFYLFLFTFFFITLFYLFYYFNSTFFYYFNSTFFYLIWQPPTFPYRLQHSIIGRLSLHFRVRDVYVCFP